MRVSRHPATLTPGQLPLDRELQLRGCGLDRDDLADRSDFEAFTDLHVDFALREIAQRLARNVGAEVRARIHVVDAPVFVPERVRDAMPVDRSEVLAGLAMDMKLHCHWSSGRLLGHAQPDTP